MKAVETMSAVRQQPSATHGGALRIFRSLVFLSFYLFTCSLFLVSCSETDESESEYADWQSRNETYWDALYSATQQKVNAGDASWKILRSWSKSEAVATRNTDFTIVHVEKEGNGTVKPLFTDSVRIHYRGRLIPSASYPSGLVFDQTFSGALDVAVDLPVDDVASVYVDGFTTALMQMHEGDQWTVYIPYTLAYGTVANGSIPAYSTLIFDLALVKCWHPGS